MSYIVRKPYHSFRLQAESISKQYISCSLCEERFAIYRTNQYTYQRNTERGAAFFLEQQFKEDLLRDSSNINPGKECRNLLLEFSVLSEKWKIRRREPSTRVSRALPREALTHFRTG
jgi:hypothetical protein